MFAAIPRAGGGHADAREPLVGANETQVVFARFEDAVAYCPFDPVLIEITDTVYVQEQVVFKRPHDYIIRGRASSHHRRAAIVGMHSVYVAPDVLGVALVDVELNGCGTDKPLFVDDEQAPCLVDHPLYITDSSIHHYNADKVICHIGGDNECPLFMSGSTLAKIPHRAVWIAGAHPIDIIDNTFFGCGSPRQAVRFFLRQTVVRSRFPNSVLEYTA